MEFKAQNYNALAPEVYRALLAQGQAQPSRNGEVLRLPGTVTLVVHCPWERVSHSPTRDANPFFHLTEALAMLGGFNNAPFLGYFAKNIINYADDGKSFNAFYGTRLREPFNQLTQVIQNLHNDPHSRQEVVMLWQPEDLRKTTKDKACNLMLLFSINPLTECLEMTTFNRSNDAIWGIVTGANVVHLSYFQEYVACALGRRMGPWSHVSNNLHVYTANPQWERLSREALRGAHNSYLKDDNFYAEGYHWWLPLFSATERLAFDEELMMFLNTAAQSISNKMVIDHNGRNQFLKYVATPLFNSWQCHKRRNWQQAFFWLDRLEGAEDWRAAAKAWLERRYR